jgi:hypothetical protein
MKKIVFAFLIIVLVSMLPLAAGAGKPAQLELNIRNQTGAVVSLDLVDANGNHIYKTLEEGVFPITLTEGIYTYYASLPCGNVSGQWNINVVKTLYLSCKQSVPAIGLNKVVTRATGGAVLQCFMLSWSQSVDHMEFWDGLNWDTSDGGSEWVDVFNLISDWQNWSANEGDLNGGPIEVDCVNPPAHDLYMNRYVISE